MIKAVVFAVVFVLLGTIVFALLAPLIFHGEDLRKIGAAAFPVILILCGGVGFVLGWRRSKKQ